MVEFSTAAERCRGELVSSIHSTKISGTRSHDMAHTSLCLSECRPNATSISHVSPSEPNAASLHNARSPQVVTSCMTCVSSQSLNRAESAHFCSCSHRWRSFPRRRSWKYRESLRWRPKTLEFDVQNNTKIRDTGCDSDINILSDLTWRNNLKEPHVKPSTSLRIKSKIIKHDTIPSERETAHDQTSDCETCWIDRLWLSSHFENVNSYDVKCELQSCQLCRRSPKTTNRSHHNDSPTYSFLTTPATLRRSLCRLLLRCTQIIGRELAKVESILTRLVRVYFQRNFTDALGQFGFTTNRSMTFHGWLTVMLVCVMVLPVPSTAAPGVPEKASEENMANPGYKNSYYAKLPPKAEYESVIICLLAVSAFIGLIVWVLKSNFEERQQKRMRREASLRERTSSVAFLKT